MVTLKGRTLKIIKLMIFNTYKKSLLALPLPNNSELKTTLVTYRIK